MPAGAGFELVVESAMEAGRLFIDDVRMPIRFPFGARATFRVAERPLRLFAGPDRWGAGVAGRHTSHGDWRETERPGDQG